jgi:hypothetical protein
MSSADYATPRARVQCCFMALQPEKTVAIMGGVSYDVQSGSQLSKYPSLGALARAEAHFNGFGVRGRLRLPPSPQATLFALRGITRPASQ